MSIMVTGGTGFIGHRIIRKLVEQGEEVVCFDLAPPRANLDSLLDRIKVYRGDMLQVPHLLEAVNTHQVHKIIHMAALLPPAVELEGHVTKEQELVQSRPVASHPRVPEYPSAHTQLGCPAEPVGQSRLIHAVAEEESSS